MDDDFNTGAATAVLFEILRALNKFVDAEKLEAGKPDAAKVATLERGATVLRELAGVLGLFRKPVEQKSTGGDDAMVGDVLKLIAEVRTAGGDKYLAPGQEHVAGGGNPLEAIMSLLIGVRAAAQKQRLCHRRPDSQTVDRDGHHAGRSPRRHRMATGISWVRYAQPKARCKHRG